MKRLVLLPILAVLAIFTTVLIVARPKPKGRETAPPVAALLDIRVVTPSAIGSSSSFVLPGRVKAAEEVTLTSRLSGRLTAIPFREGESFHAGDAIAVFDALEMTQAVESAKAALVSAAARRDQANRQAARVDSLYGRGLASDVQREAATADRESAEAAWRDARANSSRWSSGTKLSVPFDGVVVRRHVDAGVLLSDGEAILDVRSEAISEVEVAVPESKAARLTAGRAFIQSGPSGWIPAEVLRVDGMIDPGTRTRTAHLLPSSLAGIEPGAYARVRLDAGGDDGQLSLPGSSLVRRGSLTGVYVVREGRAWLRWLRLGRAEGDRVVILAGLDADEEVVADPTHLQDGAPVRVLSR